jgi:hypothetical protein
MDHDPFLTYFVGSFLGFCMELRQQYARTESSSRVGIVLNRLKVVYVALGSTSK